MNEPWFSEVVHVPRAAFVPMSILGAVVYGVLTWMWVVASMSTAARVGTALYALFGGFVVYGGALAYSIRTVVDERGVRRKSTWTAARAYSFDAIESADEQPPRGRIRELSSVVLWLKNGRRVTIATRRSSELASAIRRGLPS